MPKLGERLRALSAEKGSIAKVCRDLGINRQQFNRYLNGDITPRPPMLQKLAGYFSVSMESLMGQAGESVLPASPRPDDADFAGRTGTMLADILRAVKVQPPELLKEGYYIQHYLLRQDDYFLLSMPVCIGRSTGKDLVFKRNMISKYQNAIIRCKFDGVVFSIGEKNHIIYKNSTMNASIGIMQIGHSVFGYPHLLAGLYLVKSSFNSGDTLAGRTLLEYLGPKLKFSQFRNRLGVWAINSPDVPEIIRDKLMPKGRTHVIAAFEAT